MKLNGHKTHLKTCGLVCDSVTVKKTCGVYYWLKRQVVLQRRNKQKTVCSFWTNRTNRVNKLSPKMKTFCVFFLMPLSKVWSWTLPKVFLYFTILHDYDKITFNFLAFQLGMSVNSFHGKCLNLEFMVIAWTFLASLRELLIQH